MVPGIQLQDAKEQVFRLIAFAGLDQRGGQGRQDLDIRRSSVGGLAEVAEGLRDAAATLERGRQLPVNPGVVRRQRNTLAIGADRLAALTHPIEKVGKLKPVGKELRILLDGATNQADGLCSLALLKTEHAKQLQQVGLVRVPEQQVAIDQFGILEPALAL